jgi:hypothetical protein
LHHQGFSETVFYRKEKYPALQRFAASLTPVFSPRGKPAADMPLGLVEVEQLSDLGIESRAAGRQTLGEILVHRGLADAEFRGRGADGAFVLDDIRGQIAGAFLYTAVQSHHSHNNDYMMAKSQKAFRDPIIIIMEDCFMFKYLYRIGRHAILAWKRGHPVWI